MQRAGQLCDLRLVCGDQAGAPGVRRTLWCHSLVLASHSVFLRLEIIIGALCMFSSLLILRNILLSRTEEESIILLPNFDYEEIETLLDLVYQRPNMLIKSELQQKIMDIFGIVAIHKNDYSSDIPQDLSINKKHMSSDMYDVPILRESHDNNNKVTNKTKKIRKTKDHLGVKCPTWTQCQMFEAINCVITQRLRFTQASVKFGIPKGTLYDNILGKASRMKVLETIGLTLAQEMEVMEFCCEVSLMPYNRRTSHSLEKVRDFVIALKRKAGEEGFNMDLKLSFQWWWAFTKKYNIISLHYEQDYSENGKGPTQDPTPDVQ